MNSTIILIENLKNHYKVDSIRKLAKRIDCSPSTILNWSSGRSYPNINQVNNIAHKLGVHVSELLVENNIFTINTPIWKDNVYSNLIEKLGILRLEKDIHESFFNQYDTDDIGMSYRSFLRYINGKNKNLNLNTLDKLAKIFDIKTKELFEREEF